MHFSTLLLAGLSAHGATALPQFNRYPFHHHRQNNEGAMMQQIGMESYEQTMATLPQGTCTKENIVVRQEWDDMTKPQRLEYINAVKCLQNKPSISNGSTISRNRYDDFTLEHVIRTLDVHVSGLFFPWHRYLLNLYENALRDECNYKGAQPYWDWSKSVLNVSTVFDGSQYSFGGNGQAVPHPTINVTLPGGAPPAIRLIQAAGTGGGCVMDGPFANMSITISGNNEGAATPIVASINPRCLYRDFYFPNLLAANSYQNVTDLVLNSEDIHAFHGSVEAPVGVHTMGHFFIGGEQMNPIASPNDPVFWLHHAMLDRLWTIWQSRDLATRQYALDGTLTWGNYPPSPNATVSDILDVGPLGENMIIKDAMSNIQGGFCYTYI